MATLPRQGAGYVSLARDNQLRTELEAAFAVLHGAGVVTAVVSTVSGFTVRIASGAKFVSEGVLLTLAANQDYTASVPSSTVYVWGTLTRTAADPNVVAALDTYALTVSHNTTGTAASALHFLIAVLTTDGSGVTAIDNAPAGRYDILPLTLASELLAGYVEVPVGGSSNVTLSADQAAHGLVKLTGVLTGSINVIFPVTAGRQWEIWNATSGAFTITCKTAAGSGVVVTQLKTARLMAEGVNIIAALTDRVGLGISTPVAVAEGGTGATDAGTARTNLGLGTMAVQSAGAVAITGGTVTGITDLAVADGGTGASTAVAARTALAVAPLAAQYVTLATDAELSAERVLAVGDSLTLTDGGAGGNATADVKGNAGTPEAVVTAAVGAICRDTTNGRLYVKATGAGNTGWKEIPVVSGSAAYTPTNVTTDRAYDANATTLDQISDIVGTLIADLQAARIIG